MRVVAWFRRQPEVARVLMLSCLAALMYASFGFGLPSRYNSPDEAANAFFAGRVAAGERLAAPAPLNAVAGDLVVHPRSTVVVERKLAPASFLGFPLVAGTMGRVFGRWVVPYVTALGAVLGLSAAYFFLREVANRQAAAWGATLLAFLPGYWYYHSRGLFHNALFFDLLLAGAWAGVAALTTRRLRYYFLAGLAVGLGLTVRTSELFWVLGSAVVVVALSWREVKPRYLWWSALGGVLAFLPVFLSNLSTYGQLLSVGYRAGLSLTGEGLARATSLLAELVLPFGFNPEVVASTTQRYLLSLTWWWAALAAGGLVFVLARPQRLSPLARRALAAGLVASLWLVVLYGSWQFNDNPDPSAVTLGTSYVRYWLPLYAFGLWPSAELLAWLWRQRWGKALALSLAAGYVVLSSFAVVFDPQEGLLQIRRHVYRFAAVAGEVQARTEPESVIVVDSLTDKFFWPERAVVVSEAPVQHLAAVRRLIEAGKHVYRFHPTWGTKDLTYLNSRRLKVEGLAVEPVLQGLQGYSLYRFRLQEPL